MYFPLFKVPLLIQEMVVKILEQILLGGSFSFGSQGLGIRSWEPTQLEDSLSIDWFT
jgi:hypothetical protein